MNVTTISRYLLGLLFLVFGLNGFLQFMQMPPMPEKAGQFLGGLAISGYFFPLLKALEVITAIMLLANKYQRLALVILAPIVIHIFLFHLILTPGIQNIVLPLVLLILEIILIKDNMDKYKSVFLD